MSAVKILLDKIQRLQAPGLFKLTGSLNPNAHREISGRISSDKAVVDFRSYLEILKQRHITKTYSNKYLVGQCFGRPRWLKNGHEEGAYCRVHLWISILMFDDLIVEMKGGAQIISSRALKRFAEIVMDYLFDLKPIIEYLERKSDPNYVIFDGGKSYSAETAEVFRLSRKLTLQSASGGLPFRVDHKSSQIAATFVLRQALELKFIRLVGVGFHNKLLRSPWIKHNFYYEFIINNTQYFAFRVADFKLINSIYDWCNEIVHKVYQPLIWQNAFAHVICRGLFDTIRTDPNVGWSVHNSVEVKDLSAMQEAFIKQFLQNNLRDEIWCIYKWAPEAVPV